MAARELARTCPRCMGRFHARCARDGDRCPACERVFAPFYRGDAARTPSGDARRGTGLGLTLVRRVVEVHGGTITVEPATTADGRERGCRVVLSVPLAGPR